MKNLKTRAEKIKQEIQLEMDALGDKVDAESTKKMKEVKVLLDSSDETIKLASSILNGIKSQPAEKWEQHVEITQQKVWEWKEIVDWSWKQSDEAENTDNNGEKLWGKLMRVLWLWVVWYAIYKWIKKLKNWTSWDKNESKEEWNSWSESELEEVEEEADEETEEGTEEGTEEETEDKSFWKTWWWKFSKWTTIWALTYYVSHWLKTKKWDLTNLFSRESKNKSESNEKFKCKWWEYLWIDISSHNGSIDLNSFKNWNRSQRDSKDKQKRWISLMYIRASDNVTSDKRVSEHVNNVCNYNNQVNEDEKIAVWFYHRLSWWDWKQQADEFIKTYKNQSAKLWWKKLIPMVDVEDWSRNGWVTQAWKSNNKGVVRDNTLNWINYVEKKLGITPWIYASDSVNTNFFGNDSRFDKYKKRIARYWGNPAQSDMHQYTDKWKIWWLNNSVDLNSTQNVKQFLA